MPEGRPKMQLNAEIWGWHNAFYAIMSPRWTWKTHWPPYWAFQKHGAPHHQSQKQGDPMNPPPLWLKQLTSPLAPCSMLQRKSKTKHCCLFTQIYLHPSLCVGLLHQDFSIKFFLYSRNCVDRESSLHSWRTSAVSVNDRCMVDPVVWLTSSPAYRSVCSRPYNAGNSQTCTQG